MNAHAASVRGLGSARPCGSCRAHRAVILAGTIWCVLLIAAALTLLLPAKAFAWKPAAHYVIAEQTRDRLPAGSEIRRALENRDKMLAWGSFGPDIGFASPGVILERPTWGEYFHAYRSAAFAKALLQTALASPSGTVQEREAREQRIAYAAAWLTHCAADLMGHEYYVNPLAGGSSRDRASHDLHMHRDLESWADAYVWKYIAKRELAEYDAMGTLKFSDLYRDWLPATVCVLLADTTRQQYPASPSRNGALLYSPVPPLNLDDTPVDVQFLGWAKATHTVMSSQSLGQTAGLYWTLAELNKVSGYDQRALVCTEAVERSVQLSVTLLMAAERGDYTGFLNTWDLSVGPGEHNQLNTLVVEVSTESLLAGPNGMQVWDWAGTGEIVRFGLVRKPQSKWLEYPHNAEWALDWPNYFDFVVTDRDTYFLQWPHERYSSESDRHIDLTPNTVGRIGLRLKDQRTVIAQDDWMPAGIRVRVNGAERTARDIPRGKWLDLGGDDDWAYPDYEKIRDGSASYLDWGSAVMPAYPRYPSALMGSAKRAGVLDVVTNTLGKTEIRGRLVTGFEPLADYNVTLREAGSKTILATQRSRFWNDFTFTVQPQKPTDYVVEFAGDSTYHKSAVVVRVVPVTLAASVTLSASPTVVGYNGTATLTGTLRRETGAAIAGSKVYITSERLDVPGSIQWHEVTTSSTGTFTFTTPALTHAHRFYARWPGDGISPACASGPVVVTPGADLPTPAVAPASPMSRQEVTLSGYMRPFYGTAPIDVRYECYADGIWQEYSVGRVTARGEVGTDRTPYSHKPTFPAGTYRVRASYPGSATNYANSSAWCSFTVSPYAADVALAGPASVEYGAAARLEGTLACDTAVPRQLEIWSTGSTGGGAPDASAWERAGTILTAASGAFSFDTDGITSTRYFQARFVGDGNNLAADSGIVRVTAPARLGLPGVPRGIQPGDAIEVTGTIEPPHEVGSSVAIARFSRKVGETWETWGAGVYCTAVGPDGAVYRAEFTLPEGEEAEGIWRVVVHHAEDPWNLAADSPPRDFAVGTSWLALDDDTPSVCDYGYTVVLSGVFLDALGDPAAGAEISVEAAHERWVGGDEEEFGPGEWSHVADVIVDDEGKFSFVAGSELPDGLLVSRYYRFSYAGSEMIGPAETIHNVTPRHGMTTPVLANEYDGVSPEAGTLLGTVTGYVKPWHPEQIASGVQVKVYRYVPDPAAGPYGRRELHSTDWVELYGTIGPDGQLCNAYTHTIRATEDHGIGWYDVDVYCGGHPLNYETDAGAGGDPARQDMTYLGASSAANLSITDHEDAPTDPALVTLTGALSNAVRRYIPGRTIVVEKAAGVPNESGDLVPPAEGAAWTHVATTTTVDGPWLEHPDGDEYFKLLPDGEGGRMGVALDADGDTVVVGAIFDDYQGIENSGSAYVYVRDGIGWSLQARLFAHDAMKGDFFGVDVAIDGDTIVVGACSYGRGTENLAGKAYVFTRSGEAWSGSTRLTPTSPLGADDCFGTGVDVSGGSVAVGAWSDDDKASNAGAVYIFTGSGASWSQTAKLHPSDVAAYDTFGGSGLAIEGGTLVAGSAHDDDAGESSGSAYVFTGSGSTWTQRKKLVAPDAAESAWFGSSCAISGNTIVVSAFLHQEERGSAYVYTGSGSTWTFQKQLNAADRQPGDRFGSWVAIDGDTALVGAPRDDIGELTWVGSAHRYRRTGTTWSAPQMIWPQRMPQAYAFFGGTTAIQGDTLFVGSPARDAGSGAVYVYEQGYLPFVPGLPGTYSITVPRSEEPMFHRARFAGDGEYGKAVSENVLPLIAGASRLTDGVHADNVSVQVSGDRLVWQARGGEGSGLDTEVFTWTPEGGVSQVTVNDVDDQEVQVSGDRIVWQAYKEIFTWTPSAGIQMIVNTPQDDDIAPQVSGDRIVWQGNTMNSGVDADEDIFMWTPSGGIQRLSDNDDPDYAPQVSGDRVVWHGTGGSDAGSDTEVFTWTPAGGVQQITVDDVEVAHLQVSGDRIVWATPGGSDAGGDTEVFTWTPAGGVQQLTVNDVDDAEPHVSGDRIVWSAAGGSDGGVDEELFTWTPGSGVVQLTENDEIWDTAARVSGDRIVWLPNPIEVHPDVHTWTQEGGVTRLTWDGALVYHGAQVRVSGDRAAWVSWSGDVHTWKPLEGTAGSAGGAGLGTPSVSRSAR